MVLTFDAAGGLTFLSGIFYSSFSFLSLSLGGILFVAAFGGTTFPTSRIFSSLFTLWILCW